jgi:hypothetical protein
MTDTLLLVIASVELLQLLILIAIVMRLRTYCSQTAAKKTKQSELIKRISQGSRQGGGL